MKLIFLITATITGIKIHGNELIKENLIKSVIQSKEGKELDKIQIEIDRMAIKNLYKKEGFLDVEVFSKIIQEDTIHAIVEFDISEGKRYYISFVDLIGVHEEFIDTLTKLTDPLMGKVCAEKYILPKRLDLIGFYLNNGYPFVQITSKIKKDTLNFARVIFEIKEGGKYYFGGYKISGDTVVKKKLLEKSIKIKKGNIFRIEDIFTSLRKLYSLGIFEKIDYSYENSKDTLLIVFHLKSKSPRWISLALGVKTAEKIPWLWINSGAGHDNLFRICDKTKINTEFSYNYLEKWYISKSEIIYRKNFIKGIPLNCEFGIMLKIYSLTYYLFISEFTFGVLKYIGEKCKTGLQGKYQIIRGTTDTLQPFNSLTYYFNWDTRDNPIEPHRGNMYHFTYMYSENFQKLTLTYLYFKTIKNIVTGLRLKLGRCSGVPPDIEKFFFGGSDAISGFKDELYEPIEKREKGENIMVGNLSLRIPVFKRLGCELLLDGGLIFDKIKVVKVGTQVGMYFMTPIGPISINHGFKLYPEIGKGGISFKLGYKF